MRSFTVEYFCYIQITVEDFGWSGPMNVGEKAIIWLLPTNQLLKLLFQIKVYFYEWLLVLTNESEKWIKYKYSHSNFVVWLFLSWTETLSSFANKSIAMDGEIEANCRYISYSYFVIISIDVTLFYFKYLPIFMLLLMKHFYCIQWH